MLKKVAPDMVVMGVSFDTTTKDAEGSKNVLEVASFIHRALLISSKLSGGNVEIEGYITPLGVKYFPSSWSVFG
jgi:hypothetical protein